MKLATKPILVNQTSEFAALLRGSSSLSMSSRNLGWRRFLVERHSRAPLEQLPEAVSERYIVGLWMCNGRGEHANERGVYLPYSKPAGSITCVCPGIVPPVRPYNPVEVVLCSLEPGLVTGIEDELERRPDEKLRYRTGLDDQTLKQLMTLLGWEAQHGGPSGLLYAEHLIHALVIRLFSRGIVQGTGLKNTTSPLPRHLLRRVIERMQTLDVDLDLETLAAETAYSRTHFLRMFHAATGETPHHYLVRLRLKRAQELLGLGSMSLIDVAAECGFSSHAHMSTIFRRLLGVTPSQYRRTISR